MEGEREQAEGWRTETGLVDMEEEVMGDEGVQTGGTIR